jgi:hypothetical protein
MAQPSSFNPLTLQNSAATISPATFIGFIPIPPLNDGDHVIYKAATATFTNSPASASENVQHDATLVGAGNVISPLGVTNPLPAPGVANSLLSSNGLGVASYNVLALDASIAGNGVATPLSLNTQHDASLTGLGSVASPLSVTTPAPSLGAANTFFDSNGATNAFRALSLDASIAGNGVGTALSTNIQHDASLAGAGSTASNLTLAVQHDASLTGLGSVASVLSVTTPAPALGAANTFFDSNGTTNAFRALSLDTSIAGNGVGTALSTNIQHDASLAGAGSTASNLTLAVQHDASLTGLGSVASVLSVTTPAPALGAANTFFDSNGATNAFRALSLDASIAGNGVGTALSANIQHDASLAGAGSVASNLVLAVQHDATLTGAGSAASHLALSNATAVGTYTPTITHLGSDLNTYTATVTPYMQIGTGWVTSGVVLGHNGQATNQTINFMISGPPGATVTTALAGAYNFQDNTTNTEIVTTNLIMGQNDATHFGFVQGGALTPAVVGHNFSVSYTAQWA